MGNYTSTPDHFELPPLPEYHQTPLPYLLPPIPDKALSLILPIIAYWAFSMAFHWIDVMDFFPQYRLHTPAEVLKRNRASRWEVVRDVIIQQAVQTIVGWLLAMTEPDDFTGKEGYDIATWAQRIRMAQRIIPDLLALVGINSAGLGRNLMPTYPMLAGALLGGQYPMIRNMSIAQNGTVNDTPGFAPWEMALAWTVYHVAIPALQFVVGICVIDTWQYFLHRAMHMNKWMYSELRFLLREGVSRCSHQILATFHSRHHRLYVPYAYGALYNHPFEGFLLDTLGAGIAFKVAGMSTRQGMCFFTGSTIKTVDDHCGYALPFDPLQHITSNNAGYHDVHHQSWGIKSNFSQPFFTFWDRLLGTAWTGGDVSARYERSRAAAQKALEQDKVTPVTGSHASESLKQDPSPYEEDIHKAKGVSNLSYTLQNPHPPAGKAELQAAGSRQQILEDSNAGGKEVLEDEAAEEKQVQHSAVRSPRKRTLSSKDNFKGLRERMAATTACRTGIMGVNSSG